MYVTCWLNKQLCLTKSFKLATKEVTNKCNKFQAVTDLQQGTVPLNAVTHSHTAITYQQVREKLKTIQ